MALKTWQLKIGERTINVKALKADAELLGREIRHFLTIHTFTMKKCGILGKDEYGMLEQCLSLGAPTEVEPLEKEAEYQLDRTVYLAELPDTITDVHAEIAKVKALFAKHVRVVDERRTEVEQEAIKQNYSAMYQQQELEQQNRTHAWLDTLGASHDKIQIPQGMMAVYAQYTFDDSDIMTDYFNSHAHVGEHLLLAIVPKQAETERLARSIVSRYPDLQEHDYEWHTEKWSMGHGNYLTSEYFGTAQVHKGEVKTRLEIEFSTYDREMYCYPGYPGNAPSTPSAGHSGVKATMQLNSEHNGVEIRFSERPDDEILAMLKSNGFRWSKPQHLWYAKQSPSTLKVAEELTAAA